MARLRLRRRPRGRLKLASFPVKVQTEHPSWTCVEMLEDLLADVKSGRATPHAMMVFYTEQQPNGNFRPHYYLKNVSASDQIAFGQLITSMALDSWRQG